MNESVKKALSDAGINVDEVMERFMGNERLLERMLKKFAADTNFAKLREAVENNDGENALTASHTLKGMCANLSMTGLTSLFTSQVELFRGGDTEAAFGMMPEITAAYERILDTIRVMK